MLTSTDTIVINAINTIVSLSQFLPSNTKIRRFVFI